MRIPVRQVKEQFLLWFDSCPKPREIVVWSLAALLLYALWALVLRPAALDLKIPVFAGIVFREGGSPYVESSVWHSQSGQYELTGFVSPYLYPPVLGQFMIALTTLPFAVVRFGFLSLSVAIYLLCIMALVNVRMESRGIPRYLLGALLFYLPILNCFAAGNVQILLLGAVVALLVFSTHLGNVVPSAGLGLNFLSGSALGLSLIIKPVLWPFVIWALIRRRKAILIGCGLSMLIIFLISLGIGGLDPWTEYVRAFPKLMAVQPYVENQSIVGWLARLGLVKWGETIKSVIPILILFIWFVLFRQIPDSFEVVSLSVIVVLISPIVWYYYFILLIPAFWYFIMHIQGRRFTVVLIIVYALVQLHGLIWSRANGQLIFGNLALWALLLMSGLVFFSAHVLQRATNMSGGVS